MSTLHEWTPAEDELLWKLKSAGSTDYQIGIVLGLTGDQVRWRRRTYAQAEQRVSESPYPIYDSPLVMEGDAVILPDIELPFHNSDFLNKVLDLAARWNIRKCIVAGDLLHFKSISHWGQTWEDEPKGASGLSEEQERKLLEFAMTLGGGKQEQLISMLQEMDEEAEESPGLSRELNSARKVVQELSQVFDFIDYVLGNHDERFLRVLDSPLFPSELLTLIKAPESKWRISPYYFSKLVSAGETYQIEHPRSSSKVAAVKLASIHQCHILMAHSHRWSQEKDPSGKFWAIQMGHIVDERRLPYASQRHSTADAHRLGAVIVREGYPFLLGEETPFHLLK